MSFLSLPAVEVAALLASAISGVITIGALKSRDFDKTKISILIQFIAAGMYLAGVFA